MHKQLIAQLTDEQAKAMLVEIMSDLKIAHNDKYKKLKGEMYRQIYGDYFTDWLLKEAVDKMENEDGTKGAHWTLEQTNEVAKNHGIDFNTTNFTEYDFNYVMNMIYSDYYGSVSNSVDTYFQLAKKFLDDKDGVEGKALRYYLM